MKNFLSLILVLLFFACQQLPSKKDLSIKDSPKDLLVNNSHKSLLVKDKAALQEAIASAEPGTTITLANGVWKDVEIKLN